MDDERSMVVFGALVGAALGGLAGYLFLTERGRRLRHELEPRLGVLATDLTNLQAAIVRARDVAVDGLRMVSRVAGEPRG